MYVDRSQIAHARTAKSHRTMHSYIARGGFRGGALGALAPPFLDLEWAGLQCARAHTGAFIALRLFERVKMARRTASVELNESPAKRCRLSVEMARF